jgi:CHAT domain-containing protein
LNNYKNQYLIFISDSKDTIVDYIFIKDGTKIDQELYDQYQKETTDYDNKTNLTSPNFYNYFWKPIADKIGDAKTIYVSLGGVYNNINLNTIYNPETGKYLLEEKDIRIVNSARDFVLSKESEKKTYSSNTASLYGFANFDGNTTVSADTTDIFASTRDLNSFWLDSLTRGGMKAKPLPATKIEIDNISSTLTSKGWKVNSLSGDKASETNIKKEASPRILHIATHGYFFQDIPLDNENNRFLGMDRQQVVQDPMLRSGLLLTGANKTLKGESSNGENGLLSAAEASLLDLRETELVVLSACETGKGEIKNSEGVYGLRKAFADAGAQNIIMSLWKVDDKVTQEFMTRFYEIWLNDKTSIREAFNKTQLEIKAKYPQPYYWGAFILVGE